jgi:hypothetical protein
MDHVDVGFDLPMDEESQVIKYFDPILLRYLVGKVLHKNFTPSS